MFQKGEATSNLRIYFNSTLLTGLAVPIYIN